MQVWGRLCWVLSGNISICPGQLTLPVLSAAGLSPSKYSTFIRQDLFASQGMCPNSLSPKLTNVGSHSCSHPPGLQVEETSYIQSLGAAAHSPLLPAPSPPHIPSLVLSLSIPMETHSSCFPTPLPTCASPIPSAGLLLPSS